MKRYAMLALAAVLLAAAVLFVSPAVRAAEVPRVSAALLKQMLGKPGVVVLDVRLPQHYYASTQKIPGAVREDPFHLFLWAPKYDRTHTYVLY